MSHGATNVFWNVVEDARVLHPMAELLLASNWIVFGDLGNGGVSVNPHDS